MRTFFHLGLSILLLGVGLPMASVANEGRIPRLMVPGKKANKKEPLRMSQLGIDVEVLGNLSTTTLTMTFRNDTDEVMEGELVFPLGDGESVSRFAMSMADIETMRDGVVVEKARGRQIFESTVRRKIDPGLLEMTKGNNFRSRVYPILAKGEKRIIVGYEGTLTDAGDHYVYTLPLAFEDKIDHLSAEVRVVDPTGEVNFGEGLMEDLPSEVSGKIHRTSLKKLNSRAMRPLTIRLPKGDRATRTVVHREGKRAEQDLYFHTTVPVERAERERAKPKRIGLLWDASGSAAGRDREKEMAALGGYLTVLGDCEVSLVVFRDKVEKAESFKVAGGDWSALKGRLEGVALDGGTRLGGIDLKALAGDEFILVSDGLATFGQGQMTLGSKPVLVLNSASIADHAYLRSVARSTGGRYLNLAELDAEVAVARMRREPLSYLGLEGGGDELADAYPFPRTPVDGEEFSLAGRMQNDGAELTLQFGFGREVTQRITVKVGEKGEAESPRAKRLWAEAMITALGVDFERYRETIIKVAKKHGIVTRETSLIVLDTLDDYVQHRVIPPKEMQEEYFERIEKAELIEEKPAGEHLAAVTRQFEARKKWYSKQFPGLEAALVSSAEFEVKRAKALIKDSGIRILRKRKLAVGSLEPAEKLLVQAKELAEAAKGLEGDKVARAEWQTRAEALQINLAAFAAEHDEKYPEFTRGELGGSSDGFDGGERAFYSSGVGSMPAMALEESVAEDAERPSRARVFGGAGTALPGGANSSDYTFVPPGASAPEPTGRFPLTSGLRFGRDAIQSNAIDGLIAGEGRGREGGSGIVLKKWDPRAPYLRQMKRAKGDEVYQVYLKARRKNLNSSAFYLEVADHFVGIERKDLALRALSNIAEMDLENAPLLRVLGHRLLQLGEAQSAAAVFEEVLAIREEEPQSYRDLANAKLALGDKKRAAELLWEVVSKSWDGRFRSVAQIALIELNRLIAVEGEALRPKGMSSKLKASMPVDLRVILTWDADNTDIDLWVTDPLGETCKYNHNSTLTGGRMSDDYTQGYGPEEFVIKDALRGEYIIKAHYYGNTQQTIAGATTIQAVITTNYGRKSEKTKAITLRLREEEDVIEVGRVRVE